MTTDLTPALAREIEIDCTRLVLRFTEIVDAGRFDELADVFAPDGVFYRPADPNTPISGAQTIIESYQKRQGPNVSVHLITNVLITAESFSTASGSTRILFFAAPRDAASEPGKGRKATLHLVGDRFVRTAEGWRFAERRGEMLFNV
jgi:hypothetical protein